MRGVAKVQLEQVGPDDRVDDIKVPYFYESPGMLLRQVNVDPLLKPKMIICKNLLGMLLLLPSPDGSIQSPGNIGCPQNKNPVCVIANTLFQIICVILWIIAMDIHLHLNKKLCLDSACRL